MAYEQLTKTRAYWTLTLRHVSDISDKQAVAVCLVALEADGVAPWSAGAQCRGVIGA